MENARQEDLGGGLWLYTAPCCPVTTDSLLLAAFSAGCGKAAKGRGTIRAVDLGTGCGIIPFLWSKRKEISPIVGVELQGEVCALARRSAQEQGLAGQIRFLQGDIREENSLPPRESFDLAACNPPYFEPRAGKLSPAPLRAAARAESHCTLEEAVAAAAGLLRFGGSFCLCHRPERLCDVVQALRRYRIEPKILQVVQPRPEQRPNLILLCGRKGGAPGLEIRPTLFLSEERGKPSPLCPEC